MCTCVCTLYMYIYIYQQTCEKCEYIYIYKNQFIHYILSCACLESPSAGLAILASDLTSGAETAPAKRKCVENIFICIHITSVYVYIYICQNSLWIYIYTYLFE